jgi:hypothetical protein
MGLDSTPETKVRSILILPKRNDCNEDREAKPVPKSSMAISATIRDKLAGQRRKWSRTAMGLDAAKERAQGHKVRG